ncbi:hypothetical protein AYK81_22050 [Bacillus thuringiensis]|nr:hypothetical protein AYK81_22050 [Bacillus thuringiensis]
MMRKLTKKDHEQVLTYLKEEAALNLFIIGDIEAFEYDTDFQELWGVFKEIGTLQSILLRFHDAFIPSTLSYIPLCTTTPRTSNANSLITSH